MGGTVKFEDHDPNDTCPFDNVFDYNQAMAQVYGAAYEKITPEQFEDLRSRSTCKRKVLEGAQLVRDAEGNFDIKIAGVPEEVREVELEQLEVEPEPSPEKPSPQSSAGQSSASQPSRLSQPIFQTGGQPMNGNGYTGSIDGASVLELLNKYQAQQQTQQKVPTGPIRVEVPGWVVVGSLAGMVAAAGLVVILGMKLIK